MKMSRFIAWFPTLAFATALAAGQAVPQAQGGQAVGAQTGLDQRVELTPAEREAQARQRYEQELAALRLKTDTQEALLTLGYEIGEIDGVIGPATRGAISEFQSSQGLVADGEPAATLLQLMRKIAREKGLARPFGSE